MMITVKTGQVETDIAIDPSDSTVQTSPRARFRQAESHCRIVLPQGTSI